MSFGVFGVEPIELTGKEGSFVATGAGADFKDSGLVVLGVAGDEKLLELGLHGRDFLFETGDVLAGDVAKIGVTRESFGFLKVGFGFLDFGGEIDDVAQKRGTLALGREIGATITSGLGEKIINFG